MGYCAILARQGWFFLFFLLTTKTASFKVVKGKGNSFLYYLISISFSSLTISWFALEGSLKNETLQTLYTAKS